MTLLFRTCARITQRTLHIHFTLSKNNLCTAHVTCEPRYTHVRRALHQRLQQSHPNMNHPRSQGVAAANDISVSQQLVPLAKLCIEVQPMKSFTGYMFKPGQVTIILVEPNVMQCLVCERVIILRFPPIVYPSSICGYLRCSHG